MLSALPPVRLCSRYCVPSGAIRRTVRSPRQVCVMFTPTWRLAGALPGTPVTVIGLSTYGPGYSGMGYGVAFSKYLPGGCGLLSNSVYSSLFGEPEPGPPTLPSVALATRPSRTCCGVSLGWAASHRAAPPATCGLAIDVPLMVLVAVSPVAQADVMPDPGAKMSTQGPQLENEARASVFVV